jgi:hypothetical protein
VLSEGRIVECGSHDELLARSPGGMYASLLKHQALSDKPQAKEGAGAAAADGGTGGGSGEDGDSS